MVGSFQDSQCMQICPYKKNKILYRTKNKDEKN